jgi:hypothetical protein
LASYRSGVRLSAPSRGAAMRALESDSSALVPSPRARNAAGVTVQPPASRGV